MQIKDFVNTTINKSTGQIRSDWKKRKLKKELGLTPEQVLNLFFPKPRIKNILDMNKK